MSTALEDRGFLNRKSNLPSESKGHFAVSFSEGDSGEEPQPTIRYSGASRSKEDSRRPNVRVVRRLTGFLVELGTSDARVAFVENGKTFLYDLPAEQLRRSDISIKNQPFEMDEVEMQTEAGLVVGHRFRPLAQASDAYIEPLIFDEERKRKRDLILKTFAKP